MQLATLPKDLPNIAKAKLPPNYEAAKLALAKCERIDECKSWADKMAALASYAKQAKDDALEKACARIKARAIKRCGEIFESLPKEPGPGRGKKRKAADGPSFSPRQRAAAEAGLSSRQMKQAVRVANVPKETFEERVESDDPPTVTELAEMGKRPRAKARQSTGLIDSVPIPKDWSADNRTKKELRVSLRAQELLRHAAVQVRKIDAVAATQGITPNEQWRMRHWLKVIDPWLDAIRQRIGKGESDEVAI